uniref:Anaphase-promoting complex subunit 4 n=1 Tax=Schistocephalus solidus TaxID=70667 RepID=A0A0X3PP17_SCHSO
MRLPCTDLVGGFSRTPIDRADRSHSQSSESGAAKHVSMLELNFKQSGEFSAPHKRIFGLPFALIVAPIVERCSVFEPPSPQSVIRLNFDRFVNDDNPQNITYRIQDLQFFGPDILVVLLYRDSLPADDLIASPPPSSQSVSRGLQWFIFLPLDETLKCSTGSCVNVSQIVTSRRQVHPLPRKPNWFAVNGDRKTLFVMFDAICRVYIMEKFEADADVSTTVDDGSLLETSPTPMSDD